MALQRLLSFVWFFVEQGRIMKRLVGNRGKN